MGKRAHEVWAWPDELDALAAAPDSHTLLLENDATRVLDTRIAPGETAKLHTHRWPSVLYVLSLGHFVRRDGDGSVVLDSRDGVAVPPPGSALWSPALPPHTLENVDTIEIHIISVEVKHA